MCSSQTRSLELGIVLAVYLSGVAVCTDIRPTHAPLLPPPKSQDDHVKHGILNLGFLKEGTVLHFSSGVVAGFAVAVVTSPVDMVRTRLMNQPLDAAGRGKLYKGMVDCGMQTIRNEGVLGE
jgi:hypothetical protein